MVETARIGCIFFILTHLKLLAPKSADSNDRNYVMITSDLFASPRKRNTLFSVNAWFQLIQNCVLFRRFPVAASWQGWNTFLPSSSSLALLLLRLWKAIKLIQMRGEFRGKSYKLFKADAWPPSKLMQILRHRRAKSKSPMFSPMKDMLYQTSAFCSALMASLKALWKHENTVDWRRKLYQHKCFGSCLTFKVISKVLPT